jgi:hypothetical protein
MLVVRSSNSLLEFSWVRIVPLCQQTCFCINMRRNLFKRFHMRRRNILLWPLTQHFNLSTMFYLLTIINSIHVELIYRNELKIKDTTECSTSASYLDILLKLDANGKITPQLYDKQDHFNFSTVNIPYLCSNIPASPAYGVYSSQLIRYAWDCSSYDQVLVRGSLLTNKLMSQWF